MAIGSLPTLITSAAVKICSVITNLACVCANNCGCSKTAPLRTEQETSGRSSRRIQLTRHQQIDGARVAGPQSRSVTTRRLILVCDTSEITARPSRHTSGTANHPGCVCSWTEAPEDARHAVRHVCRRAEICLRRNGTSAEN